MPYYESDPKKGTIILTTTPYIYIHIHTHTYIHIYVYMYICLWVFTCICGPLQGSTPFPSLSTRRFREKIRAFVRKTQDLYYVPFCFGSSGHRRNLHVLNCPFGILSKTRTPSIELQKSADGVLKCLGWL